MTARLFMTTDAVGGVWRYSVTLGRELSERGWRVALAVVGPQTSAGQRRDAEDARCELLWPDVPLDWRAGGKAALDAGRRRLVDAADAWAADVVQLNQPAYGGRIWPVRPAVVVHSCIETWWRAVHGEAPPAEWRWHGDAVAESLAARALPTAPSHAFMRQVMDAYPGGARPLPVRNGAPPPRLLPEEKRRLVLAAGRIWDLGKNIAALDAAAESILWPVRVAGDDRGDDGSRVSLSHAEPLGALGADEMAEQLAAASIFVSPSLYEPFGLAVLEAARSGAALALADIPTFRELWSGAAAFFDPRAPADIARTVNELITDELRRVGLAQAALRRGRDYDIRATADKMERAYAVPLAEAGFFTRGAA